MAQFVIHTMQIGFYGFARSEMERLLCFGRLIKEPHEEFWFMSQKLGICQMDLAMTQFNAGLQNFRGCNCFVTAKHFLHMLEKESRGY